jgi:hypothetical protein
MSDGAETIAQALERLSAAVDLLDGAALRRLSAERADQARLTELELMRGDRAKLAEMLDQALTRGRSLEDAQKQANDRVDRAIALVSDMLAEKEG